jgi:hypothetical protein
VAATEKSTMSGMVMSKILFEDLRSALGQGDEEAFGKLFADVLLRVHRVQGGTPSAY